MYGIFIPNIYTEYLKKCTFLKNVKSGRHCTFAPKKGAFLSYKEMTDKYNKCMNWLELNQLIKAIPKYWKCIIDETELLGGLSLHLNHLIA